eukprot:scaffold95756_cov43-Attheya_sp.AAC.6
MLLIVESNRSCLMCSARAETRSDIRLFIISNRCCPPPPASLTMVMTMQMMRHPSICGHTEQAEHITLSIFYTHRPNNHQGGG